MRPQARRRELVTRRDAVVATDLDLPPGAREAAEKLLAECGPARPVPRSTGYRGRQRTLPKAERTPAPDPKDPTS